MNFNISKIVFQLSPDTRFSLLSEQYSPRISAFRCYICTQNKQQKPNRQLLTCSNCKLVAYCSVRHQRLDWKIHKNFCRIISAVLQKSSIDHVLEFAGPIKHLPPVEMAKQKNDVRLAILCLTAPIKTYKIETVTEFIFHPNVCYICNEFDPKKLKTCDDCRLAAFCIKSHSEEETESHYEICKKLTVYYDLYLETDPPKFTPLSDAPTNNEPFPCNLLDLIKHSTGVDVPEIPTNNKEYSIFVSACNQSAIATILAAIFKLNLHNNESINEIMYIHVVGVEMEYKMFSPDQLWLLSYWLPNVKHFEILLIGPALMVQDELLEKINYSTDRCDIILIKESYEDFQKNHPKATNKPHLIVCFNCGFHNDLHDEDNDDENDISWRSVITCFFKYQNVPIVFTSSYASDALYDAYLLYEMAKKCSIELHFQWKAIKNPYKDMRPLRFLPVLRNHGIFYQNEFLSIASTI